MPQIQMTPEFLIKLVESSRLLSENQMLNMVKYLQQEKDFLSGEDIEKLFKLNEKTTGNVQPLSIADPTLSAKHKNLIQTLLSNFLSSIDHNLTDTQVYQLYNALVDKSIKDGSVDVEKTLDYLRKYVRDNADDVGTLSRQEVSSIVENQKADEYGSKVLIQNWPDKEPVNLFKQKEMEKNLPLSLNSQAKMKSFVKR